MNKGIKKRVVQRGVNRNAKLCRIRTPIEIPKGKEVHCKDLIMAIDVVRPGHWTTSLDLHPMSRTKAIPNLQQPIAASITRSLCSITKFFSPFLIISGNLIINSSILAQLRSESQRKMRYTKGMRVEILDKNEVPSGSWKPAAILAGNGRTYKVKYDWPWPGTERRSERVTRKLLRPRPPQDWDEIDWFPGDILEVFHQCSWKIAEVLITFGQVNFSVRLLGSSQPLEVRRSHLRMRQCWENDRWVPIGKDLEQPPIQDDSVGKGLKRGKKRTNMPPAKKFRKNECVDFGQPRFTDSVNSSTCSSSGSNDLDLGSRQFRDDHLSEDASSCCWSTTGAIKSTRRDIEDKIHKLELHAYRTTLEALYHSGSITWEQEALMSNLRLELHISNEEHLLELRNLSSQSS